jgi:activating signal cointegrator 1
MKAITLTQPWAALVALGAKKIETRSWATSYRGPLAIHAAAGLGPVGGRRGLAELCGQQPFFDVLAPLVPDYNRYSDREAIAEVLPRGKILAVCDLIDCQRIPADLPVAMGYGQGTRSYSWLLTEQEQAFGDYAPGRYAWLLADMRLLSEPMPARGALGLWTPPVQVLEALGDMGIWRMQ